MFGRGSKEFDEMLKALKYADEKGKSIKSDPASLAEVVEFGDELIKAQEAVRDYLVHKEVDFERDKNRRDKEDGKKREQPRIKAALDAYEKLDTMINNTRRTVENAVRPVVQAAVENRIKLEEKFRENEKDPNKYMASIIRTADLMAKNEDVAYKIPSTLTFNGYMTRMNNKPTATYTKREVEDLYKYNKNMRTIVDTLMPGEVSEKHPKPLPQYLVTNENIKVVYKQQLKKMAQKNAGKKSAAMDDELARFKENLIAKPVNKHEKEAKDAGPILPGM